MLERFAENKVIDGKTSVDATTLEANAAIRSIVRRDTGEGYEEFLRRGRRCRHWKIWPNWTRSDRTRHRTTTGSIRRAPVASHQIRNSR